MEDYVAVLKEAWQEQQVRTKKYQSRTLHYVKEGRF